MRAALLAPAVLATSVHAASVSDNPTELMLQRLTQSSDFAAYATKESTCESLQKQDPKFTHLAYAQCVSAAMTGYFEGVGYRDIDLVAVFTAAYEAGSEEVDKGELTETQAKTKIAQAWADWTSEQLRRNGPRTRA